MNITRIVGVCGVCLGLFLGCSEGKPVQDTCDGSCPKSNDVVLDSGAGADLDSAMEAEVGDGCTSLSAFKLDQTRTCITETVVLPDVCEISSHEKSGVTGCVVDPAGTMYVWVVARYSMLEDKAGAGWTVGPAGVLSTPPSSPLAALSPSDESACENILKLWPGAGANQILHCGASDAGTD
jgi:hypothetical protein